ncbi:MAG: hypothetical protein WBY53_05770 [Acidobacteriaceae bacterium]
MRHRFPWEGSSAAAQMLAVAMVLNMAAFGLMMWGIASFAERHAPHGAMLYVLAALPTFAICSMLFAVAVYLHRERDEFQRMVMVRSLLIAIAGTLGVSWYVSMVRGLGGAKMLPPFVEFAVFWVLFGVVQMVQVYANRVRLDA